MAPRKLDGHSHGRRLGRLVAVLSGAPCCCTAALRSRFPGSGAVAAPQTAEFQVQNFVSAAQASGVSQTATSQRFRLSGPRGLLPAAHWHPPGSVAVTQAFALAVPDVSAESLRERGAGRPASGTRGRAARRGSGFFRRHALGAVPPPCRLLRAPVAG